MYFRILKMIASSGFLTAQECTKFDFGAPPCPLAGLRGLLLGEGKSDRKGGEGEGEEVGRDRERGNGREGVGMPGKRERRGGNGGRRGGGRRGGKKSKDTPQSISAHAPVSRSSDVIHD